MKMTNNVSDKSQRQKWIQVLSRSNPRDLESALTDLKGKPVFKPIMKPETGLLMVQAKADGAGQRFHMGEVTVTKCVLEVEQKYLGFGMIIGSDPEHAKLAALFDGLMQHPDYQKKLEKDLIEMLSQKQQQKDQRLEDEVAGSRVEFFTLKRGES